MDLLTHHINRLPEIDNCIWQGVWLRMPGWLTEKDRKPTRTWAFVIINPAIDLLFFNQVCLPNERTVDVSLRDLTRFAQTPAKAGCRPRIIEVNDENLAFSLTEKLSGMNIEVRYESHLPIAAKLLESLYTHSGDSQPNTGIIHGKGVTLKQVSSFAEAATLFIKAAPWEFLSADDPIAIETNQSPKPLKALSYLSVCGSMELSYGLTFYKSQKAFEERAFRLDHEQDPDNLLIDDPLWTVMFDQMHKLIIYDADLWEDANLPVAGEGAYPTPICFKPSESFIRPDKKNLNHMEACLRALALATEDEIDAGQFEIETTTHLGPVQVKLTLPMLLKPPTHRQIMQWGFEPDRRSGERMFETINQMTEGGDFESLEQLQAAINTQCSGKTLDDFKISTDTPQGQARDLCFQAFDSIGRRRRQLARQAVRIDPDCADAYVILAEETSNISKTRKLYERGVAAGEKSLDLEMFKKDGGEFWIDAKTRPYMRARAGFASTLAIDGEVEQAAKHYWALLDLEKSDPMGLRYELLLVLLQNGKYQDALSLAKRFSERSEPSFMYAAGLLLFHLSGDTPEARREMRIALKANLMIAEFLLHPGKRQGSRDDGRDLDERSYNTMARAHNDAMPLFRLIDENPSTGSWLRAELKRFRRQKRGR